MIDQSKKKISGKNIELNSLAQAAREFFKEYGTFKLLGPDLALIVKGSAPENRFEMLMDACGHRENPQGFFQAIFTAISQGSTKKSQKTIVINTVSLPVLFLYWLLEIYHPSNRLMSVKTIEQLEEKTGICSIDPVTVQQVIDSYPVRLSDHVIRQSKVSDAVAIQYLPFAEELDPKGHTLTFDGHFKKGLLEQMYQNRVIFLLDMRCPVYCRFCFRKHKSFRQEKSPCVADVQKAVDRVKKLSEVREILITGGEPLLNRNNMDAALDGLMKIDHVKTLRIATRSIAYYPQLFLKNNREYLVYLKLKQAACREQGKRIEIGVHFVHPDEVSLQSLDIISDLVKSGIPVYVQTPFLNNLNNSGPVLARLFTLLRNAGAQIYYIFTPCHPIHGTQKYWTPISESIEAHRYLRAHLSDRCIPKLCTATPLGKIEWHTSGWAVAKDESDPEHIWIRTPYTREYFSLVTGEDNPPHDIMENEDGTLNVKCLIDMGNDNLFMGNHVLAEQIRGNRSLPRPMLKADPQDQELQKIKTSFFPSMMSSVVNTPSPSVVRVHKTRVELALIPDEAALAYIRETQEITDVILHVPDIGEVNPGSQLDRIGQIVDLLGCVEHIACIRIRWQAFQTCPKAFTPKIIDQIAGLARFAIGDPLKIEIETWWLLPREVLPEHVSLARRLSCRGIQTYANLALVSGINGDPDIIAQMAHGLCGAGIDFHHIYVAGLAVQEQFNRRYPIETDQVLAIASHVRKVCSGREIPLYMIQTPLGEVDFGLTSSLVRRENFNQNSSHGEEKWLLQLDPFDVSYFRAMDSEFVPAKTGAVDENATLMVPMIGLVRPGDFPL
ncbi:MAG: radical SAM protein [Desulfobacteraceae bacterium]|nr:radical SAM protein [Desulfobacteraceae bacterium]